MVALLLPGDLRLVAAAPPALPTLSALLARLWRSGVPRLEGAWPLSRGQHTPGGTPKMSRSGPARE